MPRKKTTDSVPAARGRRPAAAKVNNVPSDESDEDDFDDAPPPSKRGRPPTKPGKTPPKKQEVEPEEFDMEVDEVEDDRDVGEEEVEDDDEEFEEEEEPEVAPPVKKGRGRPPGKAAPKPSPVQSSPKGRKPVVQEEVSEDDDLEEEDESSQEPKGKNDDEEWHEEDEDDDEEDFDPDDEEESYGKKGRSKKSVGGKGRGKSSKAMKQRPTPSRQSSRTSSRKRYRDEESEEESDDDWRREPAKRTNAQGAGRPPARGVGRSPGRKPATPASAKRGPLKRGRKPKKPESEQEEEEERSEPDEEEEDEDQDSSPAAKNPTSTRFGRVVKAPVSRNKIAAASPAKATPAAGRAGRGRPPKTKQPEPTSASNGEADAKEETSEDKEVSEAVITPKVAGDTQAAPPAQPTDAPADQKPDAPSDPDAASKDAAGIRMSETPADTRQPNAPEVTEPVIVPVRYEDRTNNGEDKAPEVNGGHTDQTKDELPPPTVQPSKPDEVNHTNKDNIPPASKEMSSESAPSATDEGKQPGEKGVAAPVENNVKDNKPNGDIAEFGEASSLTKARHYVQNSKLDPARHASLSTNSLTLLSFNATDVDMNSTPDCIYLHDDVLRLPVKAGSDKADIICFQGTFRGQGWPPVSYCVRFEDGKAKEERGLAVLYNGHDFELVSGRTVNVLGIIEKDIESNASLSEVERTAIKGYLKDTAQLMFVRLKKIASGEQLVVANLRVNEPNKCIAALQSSVAVRELVAEAGGHLAGVPYVLACSLEGSDSSHPAYQLIRDGILSDDHIEEFSRIEDIVIPDKPNAALVNAMWKCFQHPSNTIKSCYSVVQEKELDFVTDSAERKTEGDYIWFSGDKMAVLSTLDGRQNTEFSQAREEANVRQAAVAQLALLRP